jgi:hypothetical protein
VVAVDGEVLWLVAMAAIQKYDHRHLCANRKHE